MRYLHTSSQQTLLLSTIIGLCVWGSLQREANAHGAYIETRNSTTVEIQANYDSGEPMAEAQVLIYEPDSVESPRFKGKTDSEGKFSFVPDQSGDWEATVRIAGHGANSVIPISEESTIASTSLASPQLPLPQKIMVMAAVVWGFVGTALYFQKNKP